MAKPYPSIDAWLEEAKKDSRANEVGMYLTHNGVVRESPRAQVRDGVNDGSKVRGMSFSYDDAKVQAAIQEARGYEGVSYVRVWLNEGELQPGDSIMFVLIGADIRPHAVDALQELVGYIKKECVVEKEHLA